MYHRLYHLFQTDVPRGTFILKFMQFKLIIKPKPGATAKTEILIECYWSRRYRSIGTGVYVEPQYWDESKSLVTTKHPQCSTVNNLLKTKLHDLEKTAYKYEETPGAVFDFNVLKTISLGKDKQKFCDFIADCMKKEPDLELNSVTKYRGNIELIRAVLGEITVDKVTEKEIEKLDAAFHKKYADSTVARLHIFTQKYLKEAIKQRIIRNNPYDLVRLQKFRAEPKNTFHTIAELEALEAIPDLPFLIASIRDRYLYSCYTGLRISDNLALLKTQLTESKEGYVIDLHTIKGYGSDLIHPLGLMFDGAPERIARRWINAHNEPTLFPKVSREYIRTTLTVLAAMTKPEPIAKHLTFHVARHTCASLLADISQNPYLIMNILGHKDIKTSMSYIHASPEGTKKQFRNLTDWKDKAR